MQSAYLQCSDKMDKKQGLRDEFAGSINKKQQTHK